LKPELDGEEILALSVAGIVVLLAIAGGTIAARPRAAVPARNGPTLLIPFASDALHLDGELDEASWRDSARTGSLKANSGREATPYSDARFTWTSSALRIGLYAADQDIVSDDAFDVLVESGGAKHELVVNAKCAVHGVDGVKVACDSDGTLDVPGDMDEEWVVEMEVPFQTLGIVPSAGARVTITIRRCDVDGKHRRQPPDACGVFGPVDLVLSR
jgi:hypothetical protein